LKRPSSLVLAALFAALLAPGPALATDPSAGSVTTQNGRVLPPMPADLAHPSVQSEMLVADGAVEQSFAPGAKPSSLEAASGQAGAVSAMTLPDGLKKEVLGFLPYWMLNSTALSYLQYDLVSTIAYFSVGANRDGTLAKGTSTSPSTGWAGWTSSYMTDVTNQAHTHGGRVVLTVTMMGWSSSALASMQAFLDDATARSRLVGQIADAVGSRNADGVNLDFEPVPSSSRSQYTAFVRQVKKGLVDAGVGSYLTVDVSAGAATWATGWDVAALTTSGGADHLFVMGYDYHWSGSTIAGGVAPIHSPYTIDVDGTMLDFLEETSPSKLIWGVPYYGRKWPTSSNSVNATTLGGGSVALTYNGHRNEAIQYGRLWDSVGQVPWYAYWDSTNGNWVEGYYDDVQSLSAKYQLINDRDLAGTGMWTLLMDQGRSELWQLLAESFAPPFDDIGSSPFRTDIYWLAAEGITSGCTPTSYCPLGTVTREQMASFIARALKLPAATTDYFTDDEKSVHEGDINRLAAAGITGGCRPGKFCPGARVSRGEMAAFLVRALHLKNGAGANLFDDDDGSLFEGDIDRLATAGISGGCGPRRFCPDLSVTREQMAAFLHRSFR
jgi:spore germination protein YaaH